MQRSQGNRGARNKAMRGGQEDRRLEGKGKQEAASRHRSEQQESVLQATTKSVQRGKEREDMRTQHTTKKKEANTQKE